jgi:YD repeat-containing protein
VGTTKPPKIDAIILFKNNEEQKRYLFSYTNNSNTRLKLTEIREAKGSNTGEIRYKFYYNGQYLPAYLSGQTDHYGFYNGQSFFSNSIKNKINGYWSASNKESHINELKNMILEAKKPDTTLVKAEILEKIEYPTQGYTVFTYEPHTYGKKFQTWPFSVVNNTNGNQLTGGLRIKSVKNYNHDAALLSEKIYHYESNYLNGGNTSSGILSYTPEYVDFFQNKYLVYEGSPSSQNYTFFRVTSNPVYLLMPNGNHINYSEVTVEEPENGFIVYKYKNYDNGYPDQTPISYACNILSSNTSGTSGLVEYWKNDGGISMELERGQMISEEIFDSNKNRKKKILFGYNDSQDRFNDNVRFLRYEANGFNITGYKSHRITAGVFYTYFPYLKEKKQIFYFAADSVEQKETYTYDEKYRLTKTTKKLDNQNREYHSETSYTTDQDASLPIIQQMKERQMLSYPFLNTIKFPNNQTQKTIFTYANGWSSFQIPMLYQKWVQYGDNPELLDMDILCYDAYGNPNSIYDRKTGNTCILWAYKGQYPIAKIENATLDEVKSALGYSSVSQFNDLAAQANPSVSTIDNTLRTWFGNSNSINKPVLITTYTYKPLIGLQTVKDPRGAVTTYEYDDFGRLKTIKDNETKAVENYDYHYKN